MRVLYINLELDEFSKLKLEKLAESLVESSQLCYLKRKGGIVTAKAHLTLDFGIDMSEHSRLKKDPLLLKLNNFTLKPTGLEVFCLGKCDALVLRVTHPELEKYHIHFKQNYKHSENVRTNSFKPHITLAYIKPNSYKPQNPSLPDELKVSKAKAKVFGPRVK